MNFSEHELLKSFSIVERYFYLMTLKCNNCGSGPFEFVSKEQSPDEKVDIWYVKCKKCRTGQRLMFDRTTLLIDTEQFTGNELPIVNPSDKPSKLLDVGQWLAIFQAIISAAAQQEDKKQIQRLGYEATLALEEAIKFYTSESDLPPQEAMWTESTKQQFQEHPEIFERHRILSMREKLPALKAMQGAIESNRNAENKKTKETKRKSSWLKRLFGKQNSEHD